MRNSRDILFRAWDGERMVRVFGLFPERKSITTNRHCRTDIHGDFEITVKHLISDISLMQYTGLKDKNGKDIYEGDIVRHENTRGYDTLAIGAIEWCNRKAQWRHSRYSQEYLDGRDLEVIGNIYEHSHLLDSSSEKEPISS